MRRLIVKLALGATIGTAGCQDHAPSGSSAADGQLAEDAADAADTVGPARPFPEGLSEHTLTVGDVARQFRVHVPAGLGTPRALVLVLHGGGGEGMGVSELGEHALSVFRTVADREGFVVVYPGGLPSRDAMGRVGWVDCRADNTVASDADDAGFLAALIEQLRAAWGLTSDRVFMAGGSNGAQMTHAFAFQHPSSVGAIATFAGSLPETPLPGACSDGPGQPVPVLLLHGTADTQMPWGGGCVANLGGACNRGRVVSAEATRDRWLAINGLSGVTPVASVVEVSADDGGAAHGFEYAGAHPVAWWRLEAAGHTVASQAVPIAPNPAPGIQNRDLEFAEVAWAFFAARLR
jgi:polyhydroxybutyrate depolymerase